MRRAIISFILLLSGISLYADDLKFTMSAPEIVTLGEQFSLTLSLNERGEDVQLPQLADFDILMGPSVSSSRSVQIVNGRTSQTVNYSYTFILRAKTEGTYTIPPAAIKAGQKMIQSNSISIQVIRGRQQQGTQQPQSRQQSAGEPSDDVHSDENLFIKFEIDKTNAYKGEIIVATFKLYSRVGLSVANQTLPSFEGFWTQDIQLPQAEQTRAREAVNGIIYNVYTLQKKILIPQQTGMLYIEPAELTFDVQQRVRPQSIFDDFFGSTRTIRTTRKTKRIAINVIDLPPAPAAFTGAVGKFSLSSNIDKTNIATNEAITISTKVDGNGNLRHISPIDYAFPPDFEVYDPRTSYDFRAVDAGIIGSTSFEQVVLPRFPGQFTIPSKQFVYFDPSQKRYITLNTKQFEINVERGSDQQSTTVISSRSREDIRFIGEDIRYINQSDDKLHPRNNYFFGSTLFYGAYAALLLIFALITLLQKKRMRENANLALMRNKKASRIARKHLKAAAACVKNNNTDDFFETLLRAFWGYLSDKLSMPKSELNRDNARNTLQEVNVTHETIEEFIDLIDTCEMARYAPAQVNRSIHELYKQSEKLIGKFEKQIRKRV